MTVARASEGEMKVAAFRGGLRSLIMGAVEPLLWLWRGHRVGKGN